MRRTMLVGAALTALLAVPLGAQAAPAVACASDDGRDRLTPGTTTFELDAPVVAAPELAATHTETGNLVTHHRTARFFFLLDLAPYASADLDATLDWTNQSDFDLYVHDADGVLLARSDESNIDQGQTTIEHLVSGALEHCTNISVSVRNWAGSPAEKLTLSITLTPSADLLACGAGDPAPGCAGKAEGEAPAAVADARTRLYLGGDAGQASMASEYVDTAYGEPIAPFHGTLGSARPLGGVPNQYTRPLAGFRDQYANPFIGHFTGTFAEPREFKGVVTAMVWLSGPLIDPSASIVADLYLDGYIAATTTITGLSDVRDPVPAFFSFPALESQFASSISLQMAQNPMVSSGGGTLNPADATLTVWYGSAQFQSRITLS